MADEKGGLNDGEWGSFLILLPLMPIILFGMVFSAVGSGLFQLILGDRAPKLLSDKPEAFLYTYYAFVGGAVALGFYLLFFANHR